MLKRIVNLYLIAGLSMSVGVAQANVKTPKQDEFKPLTQKERIKLDEYWYMYEYDTPLKGRVALDVLHKQVSQSGWVNKTPQQLAEALKKIGSAEYNSAVKFNKNTPVTIEMYELTNAEHQSYKSFILNKVHTQYPVMLKTYITADLANKISQNGGLTVKFKPGEKERYIKQHRLLAAAFIDDYVVSDLVTNHNHPQNPLQTSTVQYARTLMCGEFKKAKLFPKNVECSMNKQLGLKDYVNMGLDAELYKKYSGGRNTLYVETTNVPNVQYTGKLVKRSL